MEGEREKGKISDSYQGLCGFMNDRLIFPSQTYILAQVQQVTGQRQVLIQIV